LHAPTDHHRQQDGPAAQLREKNRVQIAGEATLFLEGTIEI